VVFPFDEVEDEVFDFGFSYELLDVFLFEKGETGLGHLLV
jgi:hypothetical protein